MALFDNKKREFTISEGCPWHEAQQTYGAPNVNWCEPTICSHINEPANTWSNLGFLLVGVLLIRRMSRPRVRVFGLIVLVMGSLSAVYHATNNFLTQYFDFVGMALMMSFLLSAVVERLARPRSPSFAGLYWFFVAMNFFVLMSLHIMNVPIQLLMALNAVPLVILELIAGWREGLLRRYGPFALGIFTLIVAKIFAQLDLKRVYCDPEHPWLHGHVLWHLLCAVAMGFAGVHLNRMFDAAEVKASER